MDCAAQAELITQQHETIAILISVIVAVTGSVVVMTRRNGNGARSR